MSTVAGFDDASITCDACTTPEVDICKYFVVSKSWLPFIKYSGDVWPSLQYTPVFRIDCLSRQACGIPFC